MMKRKGLDSVQAVLRSLSPSSFSFCLQNLNWLEWQLTILKWTRAVILDNKFRNDLNGEDLSGPEEYTRLTLTLEG